MFRSISLLMLGYFTSLTALEAAKLPTYGKSPWYKTYHGYKRKKVDTILTTKGEVNFYPIVEKKRVAKGKLINVFVAVEFKPNDSAYWKKKKVKSTGFSFTEQAHVQKEEVKIVSTVTGDIQYSLSLKHDKKGVFVAADFIKVPKSDKGKYRLSIYTEIPNLYGLTSSKKKSEVAAKTRGDNLLIQPKDKKKRPKRWKLNAEVRDAKFTEHEPAFFKLKTKRYGKNDIYISHKDKDPATSEILPINAQFGLHRGFRIRTTVVDEEGKKQSSGIRIEVR